MVGEFQRKPRFPDAPRAPDGQEADVWLSKEGLGEADVRVAADQWGAGEWKHSEFAHDMSGVHTPV
jgi:hypothetical protein